MNTRVATGHHAPASISGWGWATSAFLIALALLLAGHWQTVQSLMHAWAHDGTYQYAFLIFPLSLWMALTLRHRLRAEPPAPSVWGLAALAMLACLWFAGHALDFNLPQHFALVAMFPALVLACWGWRALWVLRFPLAYLVVFAVPWGNGALVGSLRDFTARFAVNLLNLTHIPVLIDGREIITPSGIWMVAEACSGVKFFIACTALGCLYAYLMYQRWWKRTLFVALAAIVPVIANGFRVYFTVWIGETWGLKYASGTDHMIFGWQFFGTVLVLLLVVGWFFRDPVMPSEALAMDPGKPTKARMTIWPLVALLLIVPSVWVAGRTASPGTGAHLRLTAPVVVGWNGPHAADGRWQPVFHGASGKLQATYRADGGNLPVGLFRAVYADKPHRGHTLVTYANHVYDPGRANILADATRHIELANGSRLGIRELRLTDATGARLVWYWYCINRHCTTSPAMAMLLQAWQALQGNTPHAGVWALSSPILDGNPQQTRKTLRAFVRSLSATDMHRKPERYTATIKGPRT